MKNKQKRVLLVTQYFYPENFKSNDVAFELVKRGYKVDALVSIPNYPEGVYYKGYGIFNKRKEVINGVNVYRVFQTPRGRKASSIGLSLNYLSYVFTGSLWALLFSIFKKKYDYIFVFQTSPITQALPGILIGKLSHTPLYTWVLDIWPDAVKSNISNARVLKMFGNLTDYVYRKSEKILISSKQFKALVCERKDFSDKVVFFPNWNENLLKSPIAKVVELPKDKFVIMYAGAITGAQDIESIAKAIEELKDHKDVLWVFLGDGMMKPYLDNFVKEKGLEDSVLLLGRRPASEMAAFYSQASAMLLTMKKGKPHLDAVVPARLQSFMSAGKPVIAMADGGAIDVINEAECGYCVHSGDYKALSNKIIEVKKQPVELLKSKGQNGRKYFLENYTVDLCIDHLEKIFSKHN